MLAERIFSTLRFFDLQDYPLTAFEVQKYLIADVKSIQTRLDENYELVSLDPMQSTFVSFDTILTQLQIMFREGRIISHNGFYALPGREVLISQRQRNNLHGLVRERRIRRYVWLAKHIPFVRSIGLLGSQAMGNQKHTSDIDLFVITDPKYIGLARFLLTVYFQLMGVRRHGAKIKNRFCLNHYLAGPRSLISDRNLFTAYEYIKHRPLVYGSTFEEFLSNNSWVYIFFSNAKPKLPLQPRQQSSLQKLLEKLFYNKLGLWLENKLLSSQLNRIEEGDFTISNPFELSFHPDNRKHTLFENFFKSPGLHNPKMQ
jgi:predicted nucleotidyltransferase